MSVSFFFTRDGFQVAEIGSLDVHLVAQTATAVLNTTCLQFNAFGPTPAPPFNASSRLGHAGLILPAAAAAARARRVGRYRLSAVTER